MSGTPRAAAVMEAPTTAIVMTSGVNLTYDRATAMMMTHGRSDAVLETTDKGQTDSDPTAIMIRDGPNETATLGTAIVKSETRSADMFTCRAGWSANSFATAIASTPCAVLSRARSQPLVHSE
jgi:hypothetical protein